MLSSKYLLSGHVLVQPGEGLIDSLLDSLLIAGFELLLELLLLEGVAHGEAVVLKTVLGLNLGLVGLIFFLVPYKECQLFAKKKKSSQGKRDLKFSNGENLVICVSYI